MSEAPTLPSFEERKAMWASLDFPSHGGCPRTATYVSALRERYTNGRALFESFSIPAHPVFDWYLQRNQLHECNFFECFWRAPTPAATLSIEPDPLNYFEVSLFEQMTPFHLSGDLSSVLFTGGAYSQSTGYGQKARRLGEAAAAELLDGDYEETLCFQCRSAWSAFFLDVAWDYTAIVVSKPRRLIHVLLVTDTD